MKNRQNWESLRFLPRAGVRDIGSPGTIPNSRPPAARPLGVPSTKTVPAPMTDIQEQKRRLRRTIRQRLATLTAAQRREAVDRIRPHLKSAAAEARHILIYLSLPDELATYPLLSALYLAGENLRDIVVPWCDGPDLRLFPLLRADSPAPWESLERFGELLARDHFGIPEPKAEFRNEEAYRFDPKRLDLVIVPGRAFSPRGDRLGRGKGYYDRFFQRLRPDCRLAGLAYAAQIVESIPTEQHDRPMDLVVTEEGILEARPRT